MPLYEYKCEDCGHEFEEIVSFSNADNVACEKCGGKTERLVSTFCGGGEGEGDGPSCSFGG